jgi:hypothetical protein
VLGAFTFFGGGMPGSRVASLRTWEQHAPMPGPSRGEAYIKHLGAFRHAFFSFAGRAAGAPVATMAGHPAKKPGYARRSPDSRTATSSASATSATSAAPATSTLHTSATTPNLDSRLARARPCSKLAESGPDTARRPPRHPRERSRSPRAVPRLLARSAMPYGRLVPPGRLCQDRTSAERH